MHQPKSRGPPPMNPPNANVRPTTTLGGRDQQQMRPAAAWQPPTVPSQGNLDAYELRPVAVQQPSTVPSQGGLDAFRESRQALERSYGVPFSVTATQREHARRRSLATGQDITGTSPAAISGPNVRGSTTALPTPAPSISPVVPTAGSAPNVPSPLLSSVCLGKLDRFRARLGAGANEQIRWLYDACNTSTSSSPGVRDVVFLLVNQIMCLSHTDPSLLPANVFQYFPNFDQVREHLTRVLLPALIGAPSSLYYLGYFAHFPAKLADLANWSGYPIAMAEALNFLHYFHKNFDQCVAECRAGRLFTPKDILDNFRTNSEQLHTILFAVINREASGQLMINNDTFKRLWQEYSVAFTNMRVQQTAHMRSPVSGNVSNGSPPRLSVDRRSMSDGRVQAPYPAVHSSSGSATAQFPHGGIAANQYQPMQVVHAPTIGLATHPHNQPPLPPQSTRYQHIGILSNQMPPTPHSAFVPPNRLFLNHGTYASTAVPAEPMRFALHQAHLASPKLVFAELRSENVVKYYRYVAGFVQEPQAFLSGSWSIKRTFDLSNDQLALRPQRISSPMMTSRQSFKQDTTFYRLRCVKADAATVKSLSSWVTIDTYWPMHTYFQINERRLEERRKVGHGKDLPIDITAQVKEGVNEVEIICNQVPQEVVTHYAAAVERVVVSTHEKVKREVMQMIFPRDRTLQAIAGQFDTIDDEISFTSMTVSLYDPFSGSKMWDLPVRGPQCRHREAFDLDIYLSSRPCNMRDQGQVSQTDVWRCPICGGDARPTVLMVDEWLMEIEKELESRGQLHARAILVESSGQWTPIFHKENHVRERTRNDDSVTKQEKTSRGPDADSGSSHANMVVTVD